MKPDIKQHCCGHCLEAQDPPSSPAPYPLQLFPSLGVCKADPAAGTSGQGNGEMGSDPALAPLGLSGTSMPGMMPFVFGPKTPPVTLLISQTTNRLLNSSSQPKRLKKSGGPKRTQGLALQPQHSLLQGTPSHSQ